MSRNSVILSHHLSIKFPILSNIFFDYLKNKVLNKPNSITNSKIVRPANEIMNSISTTGSAQLYIHSLNLSNICF